MCIMYKTKRINHIENNFSTRTFSRWAHQGMSEKTALRHLYGAHKFTLSNLWSSQIYAVQFMKVTNLHCPNCWRSQIYTV